MRGDREFRIRPGRIRSTRAQQARPFIAQALAAAKKAGGGVSRAGRVTTGNRSRFGRGQRASIQANRLITARTRGAVVKARVVRHSGKSAPLGAHLDYLRRDGVTRDGEKARLFGPGTEDADGRAFAGRCRDDRHHFRFIVSPDDAPDMSDLQSFTRDLVRRMEQDLGTSLDWVGVDHWNTAHPHVHLIVRGTRDDGQDLVISRDYIKEGMRDRARDLITQELGPRSDLDIRRTLERQIGAERWTQLDRQLLRDAGRSRILDMAPDADRQPDAFHTLKVGRLRRLEMLGVADQIGQSQWHIRDDAEAVLREMGERGDIIKRMHRALTDRGIERGASSFVLAAERLDVPVIGRLVQRGLDDELKGTAYAVVDGVDGRSHHVRLPHLDAAGDSAAGSIVELRTYDDARGQRRVALAVRSDLDLAAQVIAPGATWLDRQAIARAPPMLRSLVMAVLLPRVQSTLTEPAGTVAVGAKAREPTVTSYWYLRCVLPRWGRLAASALAFTFCSMRSTSALVSTATFKLMASMALSMPFCAIRDCRMYFSDFQKLANLPSQPSEALSRSVTILRSLMSARAASASKSADT